MGISISSILSLCQCFCHLRGFSHDTSRPTSMTILSSMLLYRHPKSSLISSSQIVSCHFTVLSQRLAVPVQ